jgi:ribonuclease T2
MAIQRSLAAAACAAALWTAHIQAQAPPHGAGGKPGIFDYYVLALSWSPQFCAGPNGSSEPGQCSGERRFGFVVHGLWPQYERGYPRDCAPPSALDEALVKRMLPLMPSPRLVVHEWNAHGTCSGLSPTAYFTQIEKARAAVRIPADFQAPVKHVVVTARDLKAKFARANPALPGDAYRVACSGRYLSEVRVCLTKSLEGRACGPGLRDSCREGEIILRPLR